jgi:hypothetical protein
VANEGFLAWQHRNSSNSSNSSNSRSGGGGGSGRCCIVAIEVYVPCFIHTLRVKASELTFGWVFFYFFIIFLFSGAGAGKIKTVHLDQTHPDVDGRLHENNDGVWCNGDARTST